MEAYVLIHLTNGAFSNVKGQHAELHSTQFAHSSCSTKFIFVSALKTLREETACDILYVTQKFPSMVTCALSRTST